jgi:DNA-binding transcriptional MerR regulator
MSAADESFSSGEVVRLTGISYRTLDYWARTKLIPPAVSQANGTGTERKYSFDDLVKICTVLALRAAGLETRAIAGLLGGTWKRSDVAITVDSKAIATRLRAALVKGARA